MISEAGVVVVDIGPAYQVAGIDIQIRDEFRFRRQDRPDEFLVVLRTFNMDDLAEGGQYFVIKIGQITAPDHNAHIAAVFCVEHRFEGCGALIRNTVQCILSDVVTPVDPFYDFRQIPCHQDAVDHISGTAACADLQRDREIAQSEFEIALIFFESCLVRILDQVADGCIEKVIKDLAEAQAEKDKLTEALTPIFS